MKRRGTPEADLQRAVVVTLRFALPKGAIVHHCANEVTEADRLRDLLRNMTRMKLIRTLASWRPNLTGYRDVEDAYKIALKSLARRYIELHDEVAELDDMIEAIVKDLASELIAGVSETLCMRLSPCRFDGSSVEPFWV